MNQSADGWHELNVDGAGPGSRYQFRLPDGLTVPDPASRHQPDDVHGPSEVIDLDGFRWQDDGWNGLPWEDIAFYELHIGAFTPEGTFRAAIDKLDHLSDIGITAIQIMPISDFPGSYGWGYDGVLPYAPENSYGRPEDLMALVDAAHQRGICVFLDVVYNHFGPEGNYLPTYAPLFTERHQTPWGDGINYDGGDSTPVRDFVIENAIYWITKFRLDGLRIDAVHAIADDNDEHVICELARRVRAAAGGRLVHLVVENEDNDSDLLTRRGDGKASLFDAQWNDDLHHVLHVAATGETFGYYADYAEGHVQKTARAVAEGFVFQGEHMSYRDAERGKPSAALPPTAFISFVQNHDQIGNRALGDRVMASQPIDVIKAVAAVYLLAPQIPMLFMGEEWGAATPFPYFCDLNEELNRKVLEGRREELSRLPGFDADDLIDPTARSTFESAKLDWSERDISGGRDILHFYRDLLQLRRRRIVPLLKDVGWSGGTSRVAGEALVVCWTSGSGQQLCLLANLSVNASAVPDQEVTGETLFALGSMQDGTLAPWSLRWSIIPAKAPE